MQRDAEHIFQEQLAEDKETALKQLFELFYPRLCLFARKIVEDAAVAEDIVQEAFLKLWYTEQDRWQLAPSKGFLYTAVRNGCLNHLKHLQVRQKYQAMQAVSPTEEPAWLEAIIEAEVSGELHLAIRRLPPECGKILKLSYLEGLSNQEIAVKLQLSLQTVKNQKSRGYRLLRGLLKDTLLSLGAILF